MLQFADVARSDESGSVNLNVLPLPVAFALRPDPPAVRLDEPLADRQSEPGAADHCATSSPLTRWNRSKIRSSSWRACQAPGPARRRPGRGVRWRGRVMVPAVWRVLYRVGQQILDHLVDPLGVGADQRIAVQASPARAGGRALAAAPCAPRRATLVASRTGSRSMRSTPASSRDMSSRFSISSRSRSASESMISRNSRCSSLLELVAVREQRRRVALDRAERRAQLVRDGARAARSSSDRALSRRRPCASRRRKCRLSTASAAWLASATSSRSSVGDQACGCRLSRSTTPTTRRLRTIGTASWSPRRRASAAAVDPSRARRAPARRRERAHRQRRRARGRGQRRRTVTSRQAQRARGLVAQPDRAVRIVQPLLQDRQQLTHDLDPGEGDVRRLRELVQRAQLFETPALQARADTRCRARRQPGMPAARPWPARAARRRPDCAHRRRPAHPGRGRRARRAPPAAPARAAAR